MAKSSDEREAEYLKHLDKVHMLQCLPLVATSSFDDMSDVSDGALAAG